MMQAGATVAAGPAGEAGMISKQAGQLTGSGSNDALRVAALLDGPTGAGGGPCCYSGGNR